MQPPKDLPPISPPPAPQTKNPLQNRETMHAPVTMKTELPAIQNPAQKSLALPKIEMPKPLEKPAQTSMRQPANAQDDDLKRFEDAISSMTIDVINNDKWDGPNEKKTSEEKAKDGEYYKPTSLGEGYFSEIEHYIKNKDVKAIIDDVLTKDFLTGMKDYHDTKAQGKPFYFHNEDLKKKLESKMRQLKELEDNWHLLRKELEERDQKKKNIEKEIDQDSNELKELFRLIRINQWLESEAPKDNHFRLANGQTLKCLNDLRKALTYMTDHEFSNHVNEQKNDFSTWTKEALQNPSLGQKMQNAKTKEELIEILRNPLN